jgi:hypothetical protein
MMHAIRHFEELMALIANTEKIGRETKVSAC